MIRALEFTLRPEPEGAGAEINARISVVGGGCVGLVTAACFAEMGHRVTLVEIEPARLAKLQACELPIYEPGLDELVRRGVESQRLRVTNDFGEAIPESKFAFIAVHTPGDGNGHANTEFVLSAVRSVLKFADPGLTIVVKSTVPVGTGDEIEELVARSRCPGVRVVSNPEFLRQGHAIRDFTKPDRVVVGANPPAEGVEVALLHRNAPTVLCTRRSAELAKYAANALLATRISFMNEMAGISDAVGADIDEITQIVGMDSRVGPAFLKVGVGWGGSCLPKDTSALRAMAMQHGQPASILDAVTEVNARQRQRAFEHLRDAVVIPGGTVGVLGLAFKPDTDDLRGSPALDIIGRLVEERIEVRAHDPHAMANARSVLPNLRYCSDAYDVAAGSDALLLATEWKEYRSLDWGRMRRLMRGNLVVDGRNALDATLLVRLGYRYIGFGRRARTTQELPPVQLEVRSDGVT